MSNEITCINNAGVYLIKNFYSKVKVNHIFTEYKKNILLNDYFLTANYGAVFPALFRKKFIDREIIEGVKIETIFTEYFKYKVNISEHSDYHINTHGDWHTDMGPNKKYLPSSFYDTHLFSNIFKVAIFNKQSLKSITSFKVKDEVFQPSINLGDILIFRIEILHRGPNINLFQKLSHKLRSNFINKNYLKKPSREAIFFTMGESGKVFDYFLKENQKRENNQLAQFNKIK